MRPFKKMMGHRQEVCGLKWSGGRGASWDAASAGGAGAGGAAGGCLLASGGNDNKVCVWDLRGSRRPGAAGPGSYAASGRGSGANGEGGSGSGGGGGAGNGADDAPLWKFHQHTAAVKALAWDPHVGGILATGGGTQDKHIRFWNTGVGSMLNELDTGSQVRGSPFFKNYDEFHWCHAGMQPHLESHFARTCVDARFLIDNGSKPDMYLEVSDFGYGC